ncbi:uncharacterized protein [Temnothorax nylanderi]
MSSPRKRKILSSTDQDSAEKKIRIEKQVTEEEVQVISTDKIIAEEARTISSPFLPSYIKSCSQTQIKSKILDHTWKIDQFLRFSKIIRTLKSPSFPETGQHAIQMSVLRQPGTTGVVNFYIRTSKAFNGSCTTTVMYPPETALSSNSILGRISDMTLLIGISTAEFQFNSTDTLIIHCKFECFHKVGNNTIHMHLLPSSTAVLKDMKSHDDSTLEFKSREPIKFLVGGEQYVVSRELLYATNSSYFKDMCLTHEEIEKDMTKELVTDNEVESFKQILLYIITGSVDQCDYDMLKKLLTTADKYDVPDLKLT